ncbi:HipA domain-containing protein [Methylobacterium currus]|uniref:HipA domain-containing protein n=1 Tax=Methylobacterium currus TaxID=2051553 RepID=UPI0022AA28D5|nr:HipA domain-containing protein [Methylobacterium currus]
MRVRNAAAVLGIFLAPEPDRRLRVGSLVRDATGVITFTVDPGYIALGADRPIVSCAWKGTDEAASLIRLARTDDKMMLGSLLPPFFDNLLPEGALRELGAGDYDPFDMPTKLGADLPGAVVAVLEAGEFPRRRVAAAARAERAAVQDDVPTGRIRFSLAGVQLKFSMTQKSERLTLPMQDGDGRSSSRCRRRRMPLPRGRVTALRLAAAAGVEVAEAWLVEPQAVEGIPERFLTGSARSLAVRRFDRWPEGRRIHIEDFAQIMGGIGDDQYNMGNCETAMNIAGRPRRTRPARSWRRSGGSW